MPKENKTIFVCSNCDAQYEKWAGRCLECGKWGTIKEIQNANFKMQNGDNNQYQAIETKKLNDIKSEDVRRVITDIGELDRVLGGGIVPGSLILLGGEPGIGKSTLTMQLAGTVINTLYISGEESVGQIKLRADRILAVQTRHASSLQLANETNIGNICATIEKLKPTLTIIDSIQTIYSEDIAGEPGSVSQIRACTVKLLETAKATNTAVVIIGHITKDGALAGPKTLEHLVDTVLYLEGDKFHEFRVLRAVKNRFGSVDEIGVFEMAESGLRPVQNPSLAFLEGRGEAVAGSVVTCLIEGSRPILVEIQALVSKTAFGYPVRKASGFDLNRLQVLIAVLQKRAGLNLLQYDVHLNVVGGITADEPAADLAVCLAIGSAYKDKPLGKDLVAFGEVGLGGEVRVVSQTEKRLKECENLGMKRVILHENKKTKKQENIKTVEVNNISELIKAV